MPLRLGHKERANLRLHPRTGRVAWRYTYYVVMMKNEAHEGAYGPGEPHTLLVWRERERR